MKVSNVGLGGGDQAGRHRDAVEALRRNGVEVVDPDRTYIGKDVEISPGAILYPGTYLRGHTTIGARCQVGPDCWVEDTIVEDDCVIRYSYLDRARVRARSTVGPYAHLRPGADVGPSAHIGNFVEVKEARLERGVKAAHLAYIGDAEVGEDANIGAGTITCNFDGTHKHRTVIGKRAFIGSNAALVAPVSIGDDSLIAAGSTITEDVPAKSRAFGRARQVNKAPDRKAEEESSDDQ